MKIDVSKLKHGDLLQIRHSGQPAVFIGEVRESGTALMVVYLLGQYIVFDEYGVPQVDGFHEHLVMEAEDRQEIDWRRMPAGTLAKSQRGEVLAFTGEMSPENHPVFYLYGRVPETYGNPKLHSKGPAIRPELVDNPPRPWFGGECPVDPNIQVMVWLRDQNTYTAAADHLTWVCYGHPSDIVAYQIIAQTGERNGV